MVGVEGILSGFEASSGVNAIWYGGRSCDEPGPSNTLTWPVIESSIPLPSASSSFVFFVFHFCLRLHVFAYHYLSGWGSIFICVVTIHATHSLHAWFPFCASHTFLLALPHISLIYYSCSIKPPRCNFTLEEFYGYQSIFIHPFWSLNKNPPSPPSFLSIFNH